MNSQLIEKPATAIDKAMKMVIDRMPGNRKGGELPAHFHSIAVGIALHRAGLRTEIVIAGFLHDLIEDADVTPEEIEKMFGKEVRKIVEACSHNIELHKADREAANLDLFQRASAYGRDAIVIKIADASDNIQTIHHLEKGRQITFLARATRWQKAGEHFLGPANPLVAQLLRRIERAHVVIQ